MEWLKENWFKIACLGVILIIGLSYVDLQNTKERNRKSEEAQKQEAEDKKYMAGRKNDCLAIYETESKKFNNVTGWRFDEDEDTCNLVYKDGKPKTDAECDDIYKVDGKVAPLVIRDWLLCKEGSFENSF